MNWSDLVKSLKFWEAISFVLAGILALLVMFGVLGPEFGLGAGVVLTIILAVLRWFGIQPELRLKAVVAQYEKLLKVQKTDKKSNK